MIILIADDDRLVRFTIKSMLGEILDTEYRILEARNGSEMIALTREHMPDIVFTDIKMPCMNGMDAIAECRKYTDRTEFVVVSGYSDFEYAQRCISLGVNEYILKPIEKEKLAEIMEILQVKLASRKRESNSAFQLKVLDLFNYFSTVGTDAEYEDFCCPGNYIYLTFGLLMKYPKKQQGSYARFQKQYINKVQSIGQRIVQEKGYYSLVYSQEGTACFVFCLPEKLKEEVLFRMRKIAGTSLQETLFFSVEYVCAGDLRETFCKVDEMDSNSHMIMELPKGTVREAESRDSRSAEYKLLELTERILEAWEQLDEVAYTQSLNTMYRTYRDTELKLNLKNLAEFCYGFTGKKIQSASFKEFCRSFVDISDGMYENGESRDGALIRQVKDYITKYYMNDISISLLAEQYDLTPNYLSTLFHQRAGCKFIDYLTEVRITNAKRFLVQNVTASVQDIAVMVGYNSSRHFSALFQKLTGVTPSAYRKEKSTGK